MIHTSTLYLEGTPTPHTRARVHELLTATTPHSSSPAFFVRRSRGGLPVPRWFADAVGVMRVSEWFVTQHTEGFFSASCGVCGTSSDAHGEEGLDFSCR